MEDTYKTRGMRRALVKTLESKGIKDRSVLEAVNHVPRHFFFDDIFLQHAYQDKAFPIGEGQTISQPYTVAYQTEKLKVKPGNRVLEIGTGSGYQACILCEMGIDLFTIEYNKILYEKVKKKLPSMGYKPRFFLGDGSKGLPAYAPYDGIIVTAGAPTIPNALIEQLSIGGRLIIPVGDNNTQQMIRLTRITTDKVKREDLHNFSFVPLLGESGWHK